MSEAYSFLCQSLATLLTGKDKMQILIKTLVSCYQILDICEEMKIVKVDWKVIFNSNFWV